MFKVKEKSVTGIKDLSWFCLRYRRGIQYETLKLKEESFLFKGKLLVRKGRVGNDHKRWVFV